MSKKTVSALLAVVLVTMLTATGCSTYHPSMVGQLNLIPIPVSPYLQDEMEDQAWEKERYDTVPILDPIPEGAPTKALDPPSQDEVMRALEDARPLEGGLPFMHEVQRNNVRIVVEPIADFIDPPRVVPLAGPVQLHHARYKCTVYFSEVTRVGWPIPYTTTNEDAQEVLYIDHSHFHRVGNVDAGGMGAG